nr:retrovirus-related Pol polyprotein from transposon TNT 1-94 [Tanacetum cinerariifolium]
MAMSLAEAEYVDAAGCCAEVLWIKSQLADYDVLYDKVPIFCDNTSVIAISNNLVFHFRTKHIDIKYHFIRDHILKEVEEETKTITFLLSWWDEPLSFTQKEFISAIGLPICKNPIPPPPKETVKSGLVTLGLFDKDKPTLSSTVLVNTSPLKMKYFLPIWKLFIQYIVKCLGEMQGSHDQMNLNQQTIAYCLIYGLEIDIRGIIFSDLVHKLQNEKKNKESNICYTRFLSLVFEKLIKDKYIRNDLTRVKPHTITTASFQKPLALKVSLSSHMLKVAKLYQEPEQSLIPPSREVNVDDTSNKSFSRAFEQPITQPKAPIDLKTKKKKIPSSSQPKSLYKVRVILPKKQVVETQHAEVTVATADATKSLEASELAEEQGNQPSAAKTKKEPKKIIEIEEDVEDQSMEILTVKQLLDEVDKQKKDVQETPKSPYDTESEIKVVKSYFTSQIPKLHDQIMHDSDESADNESMPKDDLRSV